MIANCRGTHLWVETAGTGGTPVLLVMGFGLPGAAWHPQIRGLSPQHRVAWFDNRGVGRSEDRPGYASIADLAEDATGVLDHLGWDDAHVVGVSMGGMVAQELALRHKKRVRSLTLIATQPGGRRNAVPSRRGLRLFAKANATRGATRLAALRELLFPGDVTLSDDDKHLIDAFQQPIARHIALRQLAAILAFDARRRLPNLGGVPTLIVRPGQDLLIRPTRSDELFRRIPGATLTRFDDAGHGVSAQRADDVNRELLRHMRAADLEIARHEELSQVG
jgi:3-oxoadipate enol-lactonase